MESTMNVIMHFCDTSYTYSRLSVTRTSDIQGKLFQLCIIPVMLRFTMEMWSHRPELSSIYVRIRITGVLLMEGLLYVEVCCIGVATTNST